MKSLVTSDHYMHDAYFYAQRFVFEHCVWVIPTTLLLDRLITNWLNCDEEGLQRLAVAVILSLFPFGVFSDFDLLNAWLTIDAFNDHGSL